MGDAAIVDRATLGPLQTDTFCDGCGYNLHGRPVHRDERLGLLVCQCPECGAYAPAGHGSTATRLWLNRLATALLVAWLGVVLGFTLLLGFFLGVFAYAGVMRAVDVTGQPVQTPHGMRYVSYYVVEQPDPSYPQGHERMVRARTIFLAIDGVLGFVGGLLFAGCFWHVRGPRRVFALVPAILGCGGAALIWVADPESQHIRGWGLTWVASFFLLASAATGLGLLLGRPVARAIVMILIPPKARQHVSFLWETDGMKLAM